MEKTTKFTCLIVLPISVFAGALGKYALQAGLIAIAVILTLAAGFQLVVQSLDAAGEGEDDGAPDEDPDGGGEEVDPVSYQAAQLQAARDRRAQFVRNKAA